MTDTYNNPGDADPFARLNEPQLPADPLRQFVGKDLTKPPAPAANTNDPLREFVGKDLTKPPPAAAEPASSSTGALVRGAIRSIAPTLGGLATFGPGAEIGAAVGAFGGPAAPITVPLGGLIGGTITSLGGSYAVSAAQNWALSRLPDSWKESLDSQQKLDEEKHPVASFLGGLLPMAVAMRPGAFTRGELPENSTALQRIMANPVTARIFGGAVMGGMELGQEAAIEDHTDWRKVAIATGFGIVFNQPTRLGQAITELGARPTRRLLGRSEPIVEASAGPVPKPAETVPIATETPSEVPAGAQAPTVAQSGDVKVMGPGITESVFHGGETINPAAAMTAHETARNEQAVFGAPNVPDLHATARQFEPETFARYDDLLERRETFRKWIAEHHTPSPEAVTDIEATETPELAAARKHLMATDMEIRDVLPEVRAAYRRAADRHGTEILPVPEIAAETPTSAPTPSLTTMLAERPTGAERASAVPTTTPQVARAEPSVPTNEVQTAATHVDVAPKVEVAPAAPVASPAPRPIEEQRAAISKDVSQKLIAAGRPAEEAQAYGALWADFYETRAGRFNGARGTPEELYRREGAQIRGNGNELQRRQATLEGLRRPVSATPRAPRDPSTLSLLEFLASRGGIDPNDALIGDVRSLTGGKRKFVPGFGDLVRQGGMRLDAAREAAVEAGYLHDPGAESRTTESTSTINTLLEAMDNEIRGERIYPHGRKPERVLEAEQKRTIEENERHADEQFDEALKAAEIDPQSIDAGLRKRTLDIMKEEGERDPMAAYERAVNELEYNQSSARELFQFAGENALTANLDALKRAKQLFDDHAPREQIWADTGWFRGEDGNWKFEIPDSKVVRNFGGKRLADVLDHPELFKAYPALARVRVRMTDGENSGFLHTYFGDVIFLGRKQTPEDMVNSVHHEIQHWIQKREGFSAGDNYRKHIAWWNLLPSDKTMKAALEKYFNAPGEVEARLVGSRAEGDAGQFPWETARDTLWRVSEELSLAERQKLQHVNDIINSVGWEGNNQKYTTEQVLAAIDSALKHSKSYEQEARGKIRLVPNNKSIITLMKDANASTFGHESGHEFLNQLMQDADHAQAPEQLKTDAATTLKWLGVDTADDIKTRHHEKFATGFEQYLREGVAPSPGLARVFAQFRDWLLKIYQTLRGLGKEISPDIRDVFDRMLALEPQRTVIAPEALERGPTLHDIHAADAATMEPHEADAAMARAAVETQRFTDDIPPERMHEFEAERARWEAEQIAATGAEPGPAPRGGEGEPGDMGPHGGEPEPIAPSSGNRAQSGTVVGRSGDAGREGTGTPSLAGTERGAAAFAEQHPLASGPADLFGVADSPLIDKAGNIRLENLTTSEEVRAAYRASAERNDNFIGERGGKVTDGEVLNLAYDMGMQGAEKLVQKWVVRQALNAEQIMAVRLLSRQSAQAVHDAHVKVAQTSDPEAILAQVEAEARHDMIQATLSGITAEAGRAMRALRHIRDEAGMKTAEQIVKEATGKTLFQKLEEAKLAASLDTPQEVAKHMNDRKKRSYGGMVVEYWINGKLSGFATQVTNFVGNTIMLGQHSGPETAVAALIGAAAHALGRDGSYIRLGEIPARLRGLREGLPGALKATGQSFYAGTNLLLPGEKPQKMPFQIGNELAKNPILDEAATYASIGADMFGTIQGLRDGIIATGELIKAGGVEGAPAIGTRYSLTGSIPDLTVRGVTALPLGTITRMPGRFLVAADAFFKASNYSMAKNAMAYRMASDEGHVGTAFDARVADIRQNPSEELMEQLHAEAAEQTLMEKGGKFLAALSHLSNVEIGGFPMLKFVSPFVHVAGNIINQTVMKRTPLAFLSTELRADLTGRNGNAAQDQAMARVLIGTGLAITIGTLAAQGYVDGSGPTDQNEAAMWRMNGHLPHSVRIGETMYEMQKLGPLGLLVGIAADLYDVSKSASEGEMTEAASHLVHAFSQNILDQSMMKGPSDLLRAITDSDRYGEQYVRSFLSSFLPADVLMAQIAKANDPYTHQARTVVDAIRVKIPGHLNNWFENELFPKRDIWGEPMAAPESLGGPSISGIHYRQMTTDPVNISMLELKMNPGPVPRKIRNVDLTDEQFDDFARIAGRTTKIRLDKIVASPDFQRWAPHIRRDVINEVLRQSREMARGTVMVKYPQIIKDATEERLKKARGED